MSDAAHDWGADPGFKQWLRAGEAVHTAAPCAAVNKDGIRRGCLAVAVEERFCIVDFEKHGKLLDFVEHGYITNMWYFEEEAAWVVEACDRVLALKVSRSTALAFIATTVIFDGGDLQVVRTVTADGPARDEVLGHVGMAGYLALLWHDVRADPYAESSLRGPLPPPGSAIVDTKTYVNTPDVDLAAVPRIVRLMLEESDMRLVEFAGRGRTLVAGRAFAAGEVIWQEEPFLYWQGGSEQEVGEEMWRNPSHIGHQVFNFLQAQESGPVALPTEQVPEDIKPPAEYYKRWQDILNVNCWGFSAHEEDHRALFIVGSLFNHSCEPNVRYDTKVGRSFAVFRALRPIAPGEELLVPYTMQLSTQRRYDELLLPRRFRCACPRCIGPDVARSRRCPRAACGRGIVVPTPVRPRYPEEGSTWRCDTCCRTLGEYTTDASPAERAPLAITGGEEEGDACRGVDVSAEQWIVKLVETHMHACDLADPPAALVAALRFAAEHLGPAHCTVVLLAMNMLNREAIAHYSVHCYVLLCRIVLNWCLTIRPGTLYHNSDSVQALANGISKLQNIDHAASTLPIISIAHHLVQPFTIFRGANDADAVGMRTVSGLRPNAWDALLGFDWRCPAARVPELFEGLTAASLQDLKGRVDARLVVLRGALASNADPYEL